MDWWSDELKQATINHFEEMSFNFGADGVGMKHCDGRFGLIRLNDALNDRIIIHSREDDSEEPFDTIKQAVDAGWALD